ncbi:glycosyltransferase family 2 protein [Myceligenerans pegani]|uniref:Glycosyltransferase n=1 Tax=Myceligenerans pegani TaxID=2776917 RepID=A0ABR9MV18_9MICO|nr:glycosyltransferase [Myceligenerans sp. TRM 65318]MBE1875224.1 glycosyltransferase [Myceligenerans sp. TRM 65318]MBE3017495.1 glycosyltransferase [Myceligenerans sp. TRM 65318]
MGTDGDVALITVTYNSARALAEFWEGKPFGPYPWIVVDNASSDDSARVARELGARVLDLPSNQGFSAANNIGAATVDADVLIFCNPDVTVTEDGIAALADGARRYGGIVAPQLVNANGTPQENGRGTPFLTRKLKHLFRLPDERYQRFARPGELVDVVWAMGAALAITRRDFQALAGWDDGFFVYYEDADLGVRAWQQGLSVRVDGDVRWLHGWGRETGRGFSASAWKLELAGAWRFYRKHPYCLLPVGRRAEQLHRIDSAGAMIGVGA